MEFPTPADMSLNSPHSSERIFSTLEYLHQPTGSDEDKETLEYESSGNGSPAVESPVHKRYLYPRKEFVDELHPEELRWFHRADSTKKWQPFIGYDSLRIECRYRALAIDHSGDLDADEKILVLGGLFEVDVNSKKCYPVYWSGDGSEIMRGTWFYESNMQPLEDMYAKRIEEEHINNFLGRRLEEAEIPPKGQKPVIHNVKFSDFHVDWNATNEVYMYSETTMSNLRRKLSLSMGFQKSGIRIRRGYCYESQMEDKPPDITHVVFVVHGIGQKMEQGSIVRCVNDLRERVNSLQQRMFPDLSSRNKRCEFLPVEWRSSLRLDGDTVESITPQKMKGVRSLLNSSAMDILYYTSPLYRQEIICGLQNELQRLYAMFCTRHPYFEANGGNVSIIAHSLGSVITFDILTKWNPIQLYDQFVNSLITEGEIVTAGKADGQIVDLLRQLDESRERVMELESSLQQRKQYCQKRSDNALPFEVENFFCLGSPLAVFLALRGVRPQGPGSTEHLVSPSACRRLFNIFHPADPVAYRLEPLVLKHYSTITPLSIHNYNAVDQKPYNQMTRQAYAALNPKGSAAEQKAEELLNDSKTDFNEMSASTSEISPVEEDGKATKKFSLSKWFSSSPKKQAEAMSAELQMIKKMEKLDRDTQRLQPDLAEISGSDMDKTELEYRLDYQLRERSMENKYLSLLTSHTAYWTNKDVALFILIHLFPQLQELA